MTSSVWGHLPHDNANTTIAPQNRKGVIHAGIDVHKKPLQVAAADEKDGTLLLNERMSDD